jgi:hypothetical protein
MKAAQAKPSQAFPDCPECAGTNSVKVFVNDPDSSVPGRYEWADCPTCWRRSRDGEDLPQPARS